MNTTATTATDAQREARLAIAESLWNALKALNADDVHGAHDLAVQQPGRAYYDVSNALVSVLVTLVDGDLARAESVREFLADNYESVAHNLAYEAHERKYLAALAVTEQTAAAVEFLARTLTRAGILSTFIDDNGYPVALSVALDDADGAAVISPTEDGWHLTIPAPVGDAWNPGEPPAAEATAATPDDVAAQVRAWREAAATA